MSNTFRTVQIPGRPRYHIPTNRRAAIGKLIATHEKLIARVKIAVPTRV